MDIDDIATNREMEEREAQLKLQRSKTSTVKIYTGYCQYSRCEAEVGENQRFCDAECRDGYDTEQRMLSRLGRV